MTFLDGIVYQSIAGYEDHLQFELGHYDCFGPLYHAQTPPQTPVFWQHNSWLRPFTAEFDSITDAARLLSGLQRNWAAALWTQFRRGALIGEKLPPVSAKPKTFPWFPPQTPLGAWTLLDAHTLLASQETSSPFPSGCINFIEDKIAPPSRAYLKLWEAFCRAGKAPQAGERCFDAGASPGGWSWALARLGAQVIACDRSPLAAPVANLANVSFCKHDAFTLKPREVGALDWLLCDAACYPERLFDWIRAWLDAGLCSNFICTLKMQGTIEGKNRPDFETPRRFAQIDGSQVVHLNANKHELTWIKVS